MLPSVQAATLEELEQQKESAHKIAQEARDMGLDENHTIIVSAKELWKEADTHITNGNYEKPMERASVKYYNENDVTMLAKLMYGEGRGIPSKTQLACVGWTVLNRVDAGMGSISQVITAPNQFYYRSSFPMVSDYGYDLKALSYDILERWNNEKNGLGSDGRVLPSNYLYYHGNGRENIFRTTYKHSTATYWNYSLPTPYDS